MSVGYPSQREGYEQAKSPSGDHERRAQRVVHLAFRAWTRFGIGMGLFRVQWRGRQRQPARGPAVIVTNHPTLIDVVFPIACLPQADCVVKGFDSAWVHDHVFNVGLVVRRG